MGNSVPSEKALEYRRRWGSASLLVVLLMLAASVNAKDSTLPKLVVHATYIRITTDNGSDFSSPRVYPEDKEAAIDVWDAVRKWGKYRVVNGTSQVPELVLLVRKGRRADVMPSVGIHAGSDTKPGITPNTQADIGSTQDMLALYEGASVDNAPLWRRMEAKGLDAPQVELVQQLRAAVEAAAKVP